MQVGLAPAQRADAQQHLVAYGLVDRAQLEQVEREGLAVVGRGDEQGNAPDLAAVRDLGAFRPAATAAEGRGRPSWWPRPCAAPCAPCRRRCRGRRPRRFSLRIKHLADCLLARADLSPIFAHSDKDTYHVLQANGCGVSLTVYTTHRAWTAWPKRVLQRSARCIETWLGGSRPAGGASWLIRSAPDAASWAPAEGFWRGSAAQVPCPRCLRAN